MSFEAPDGFVKQQIVFQLSLIRFPIPNPQSKNIIKLLTTDFVFQIFTRPFAEWFADGPETKLQEALESATDQKDLKRVTRNATKCVVKGIGECFGEGKSLSVDIEKLLRNTNKFRLRPWLNHARNSAFFTAVANPIFDQSFREYFAIIEELHNCVEAEVESRLVCKDFTRPRVLVPCIKTECLDGK
jgi:hypothetical protein